MTAHDYHPRESMKESPVLFDGCPRCEEHAAHPEHTLDISHLIRLRAAWEAEEYKSKLDKQAAERAFGTVRPDFLAKVRALWQ
jgi:hypothetical protein